MEVFRVLSDGVTLSGRYGFTSLTRKGIERRLDGVYEPEDHDGPSTSSSFKPSTAWRLV